MVLLSEINLEEKIEYVKSINYEVHELKLEAKKAFDSVNIYLLLSLKLNLHPMLALCLKRRAKQCREEYMVTVDMREEIEQEIKKAEMYNLFDNKEECFETLNNANILLRWEQHYYLSCINKFEQVAKDVKEQRFKNRSHLLSLLN